MTEKELEKLFRNKLGNREFAYNPDNWAAMEAMLDGKATPAGPYYWRSAAAIVLFGVAVSCLLWLWPVVPQLPVTGPGTGPASPATGGPVIKERPHSNTPISTKNNIAAEYQKEKETTKGKESETYMPIQRQAGTPAINKEGKGGPAALMEKSRPMHLQAKSIKYDWAMVGPGVWDDKMNRQLENWSRTAIGRYTPKQSFYIEFAPVFTGSQNANNVGVGWQAGIGYHHTVSNKLYITAGINYLVYNGVNISNKSDSVFYNFGKEVVQTEELCKRLEYIEVPLTMGYTINEKHSVVAGGYASFLVNVAQEVNRETSGFKTETQQERLEKNGYSKDFSRWDFGLHVGYRYRLTPLLSVGLHYSRGLQDVTRATKGTYQQRHNNSSTRVVFRYSIL